MSTTETSRTRLVAAVDARRAGIERYLAEKRPVDSRLTTVGIVSSCVAAALTAGPAVGGEDLAGTVQNGLGLPESQAVWRLLCVAAVIASLTAAIAANLSRSGELSTRIAAAEAAASLLDGLSARLRFSRLAVADGARQYEEIVTRIPWISEVADEEVEAGASDGQGRAARQRDKQTRYLVGATALAASFGVVTAIGLVVGLIRGDVPAYAPAESAGPGAAVTEPAPPTSSPAVVNAVYSGRTESRVALAVVVEGDRAAAYLCDGDTLEAWLDGTVDNGQVTLSNRGGATLDGDLTEAGLTGTVDVDGSRVAFSIAVAGGPAGVYEARENIGGIEVRFGWAVLEDGSSIGIGNRAGELDPAPPLTFPGATFQHEAGTGTAEPRSGDDPVVAR